MNKKILVYLGIFFAIFFTFFTAFVVFNLRDLPDVRQLEHWKPMQSTQIFDDNGKLFAELYIQKRQYVPLSKVPDIVKKAFIAAEDKSFYTNPGVDIFGIARAFVKNLFSGRVVAGGSTISQQLVKNLFLTPERSLSRKIKEFVLAIKLNRYYSKDKILEMYLNQIYLGHGSYGVQSAAQTYFNKNVWELDVCEAAVLAGLPKAPSYYDPYKNPEAAKKRQLIVLQNMLEEGYITEEEYKECAEKPIKLAKNYKSDGYNDYATEMVRQWLVDKFGDDVLYKGGYKVYTTLDKDLQIYATNRIQKKLEELQLQVGFPKLTEDEINQLKERYENQDSIMIQDKIYIAIISEIKGKVIKFKIKDVEGSVIFNGNLKNAKVGMPIFVRYKNENSFEFVPFLEGAVVSIDSHTGKIKAIVGGYSIYKSQFNRVFQSKRQPGSAFKPIIYMAALLKGYTQISLLKDEPISFWDYSQNKEWIPSNYDGQYRGTVLLRTALAQSLNAATVYLLSQIDFDPVLDVAQRVGITSRLPKFYSLALGSIEVSPIELATAFATFGNEGTRCKPFFIKKVIDPEGKVVFEDKEECMDVLPKPETGVMLDLLRAVVTEGTATRAASLPFPVAGKTGTTNDYADAWFAGFDPDLTTVVWVGYDRRKPIGKGMAGAVAALPLWMDIMAYANRNGGVKEFSKPDGVVYIPIDPITRTISVNNCPKKYMAFVEGTYPTVDCEGNPVDLSKVFAPTQQPSEQQPEQQQTEQPEQQPPPEQTQSPENKAEEKIPSAKDILNLIKEGEKQ
ncbi:penicillin-binding protein 1A [Venenivibrio stagnispumantis]|uniref:Penicillin-binding protein 1A n=1 Tax=Venenivibrio stagnispumantis TaxID=407998 RepID=A0AA46ADH9_9AQUI|nr:PBP1A family penicillin-binding protein [Venenivibrio stagnispumantis]MCW4572963.1 PBP1A family penicillin-binding protein [Venenivibrio stagnispumantis]SMP05204.1 penicillin-binding protein 1A [Venenivibrio stagnispumantis]